MIQLTVVILYLLIGLLVSLLWWYVLGGKSVYKEKKEEAKLARLRVAQGSLLAGRAEKHAEEDATKELHRFILGIFTWPLIVFILLVWVMIVIPVLLYETVMFILRRTIGR